MEMIEWTHSLELGIDVIDHQHHQIADYINSLTVAIEKQDEHLVFAVLEKLRSYTVDHFVFEEELMLKAGYCEYGSHSQLHRRFEHKVSAMLNDYVSGSDPFGIARKARNFLHIWLIEHIRHEDKEYAVAVMKIMHRQQGWIDTTLRRIFGQPKGAGDYQNNQA